MLKLSTIALSMFLTIPSAQALEATTITGENGQTFNVFVAGPEDSAAGVLIVHDWFGVSAFTKESVERLGRRGIRALAVDLFDGESATNHEQAKALSGNLKPDHAQAAIVAGLKALRAGQRPVAVAGYSMGGRFALRAAAASDGLVKAVALIYAGGFGDTDDQMLASVGPILAITGSADDWSYAEHAGLEKRLRGLGGHMETYVYPGVGHAFAQQLYDGGKTYDGVATSAMHNVLDAFLTRHLGMKTD